MRQKRLDYQKYMSGKENNKAQNLLCDDKKCAQTFTIYFLERLNWIKIRQMSIYSLKLGLSILIKTKQINASHAKMDAIKEGDRRRIVGNFWL